MSSKRIIVVGKAQGQAFEDAFISGIAGLKVGEPTAEDTELGPVSSERALNLLLDQISAAKKGGAKVVAAANASTGRASICRRQS